MNETKTQILIITEWVTILGTILGCVVFLNSQIQIQSDRVDRISEAQSARTDRLYEMFIDLLKERR